MGIDIFFLRLLNGSDSMFLDRLAVTLTSGYVWIPLYVFLAFLVIKNNKSMSQILLVFFCGIIGVLLSGGLSDLVVKPLVMRHRPCFDPVWSGMVQTVEGYSVRGYSFFSSHAANTMSLAVFFSLLTRHRIMSIVLIAWSFFNAWTRIYLGVHWFTDVLTGLLWGALTGVLVYILYYRLFYRISPKVKYVSTKYTVTGYSHNDIYMCMSIITLTVIYGILRSVAPSVLP